MTEDLQVKVLLRDDENVETVWAQPVGPDQYRLDNSPLWAYGVSWRDVVEAHRDEDGMLAFVRIVEKSGHRTLRLILKPPADKALESQAVLDGIVALGATYEGMNPGYLAIDVPPEIALDSVTEFLVASGQQWEHADPPYSDLYPDDS